MSANLEQARAAKKHLAAQLVDIYQVNGIGIVRDDGGYGLKVNLLDPSPSARLPREVDGVKVSIDIIGPAYAG